MGNGIFFALIGLFVIIFSQKMARLITMDRDSKVLEKGMRIFIPFFGSIVVVVGLLIAFDLVQSVTNSQINYTRAYFFIILGAISIIGSPFIIKYIFRKYPDSKAMLIVSKKDFYVFYIGLGIITITAGILELTGL